MSGIIGTSHSKSKVIGRSMDTAKAWVRFDASSWSEQDSFNVSSVGDEADEIHKINFQTPMPNNTYCFINNSQAGASSHVRFSVHNETDTDFLRIQGRMLYGSLTPINYAHSYNNVVIFCES